MGGGRDKGLIEHLEGRHEIQRKHLEIQFYFSEGEKVDSTESKDLKVKTLWQQLAKITTLQHQIQACLQTIRSQV